MTNLRSVIVPDRFTYYWLAVIYILSALGAYQLFSIPLPWFSSFLALLSFNLVLYQGRACHGFDLYLLFLILLIFFVSILGWRFWISYIDFSDLLPEGATTDYYLFTFLRYVQYVVFFAVYCLSISFLSKNGLLSLANMVVLFGAVISIYAVYVYIAQISGLPEIPRNRIGTGGEEQSVIFTYAFHRAMGSFREPSHLSQWLVLPFFMTFLIKSYWYLAARIAMVFVVLLTGSLTGIIAIFTGYLFANLVVFSFSKALFSALKFAIVLLLAGYLFSLIVLPYAGESVDILAVLIDRLIPILQGGLEASNRGHIYEYVSQHSVPPIGYGFGNANLLMGDYMGHGLVGSFLSLYLNMLYSLGYLGFPIAMILLLAPVFFLLRFRTTDKNQLFVLLGAYIGWFLVYAALTEELSISFAILYGACVHYYRRQFESISLRKKTSSLQV